MIEFERRPAFTTEMDNKLNKIYIEKCPYCRDKVKEFKVLTITTEEEEGPFGTTIKCHNIKWGKICSCDEVDEWGAVYDAWMHSDIINPHMVEWIVVETWNDLVRDRMDAIFLEEQKRTWTFKPE